MSSTNLRLPEVNNINLVGRLTRDPEIRYTGKGQPVCRFDLAVNRRYKDASGNWQDDTSFIPMVVWGESANRCGERLKKGSPVHVEGRLQSRQWETKEGQKRTTIEVIARRVQFLAKVTASVPVGASVSEKPEPAETVSDDEEIPF